MSRVLYIVFFKKNKEMEEKHDSIKDGHLTPNHAYTASRRQAKR